MSADDLSLKLSTKFQNLVDNCFLGMHNYVGQGKKFRAALGLTFASCDDLRSVKTIDLWVSAWGS